MKVWYDKNGKATAWRTDPADFKQRKTRKGERVITVPDNTKDKPFKIVGGKAEVLE